MGIAKPSHLDRCWFSGEDRKAITRSVPGGVDQNVDAVGGDLRRNRIIGTAYGGPPVICERPKPLSNLICPSNLRVTKNFHDFTVMRFDQWLEKLSYRVLPEIRLKHTRF
jgi:hypothetical protein